MKWTTKVLTGAIYDRLNESMLLIYRRKVFFFFFLLESDTGRFIKTALENDPSSLQKIHKQTNKQTNNNNKKQSVTV